MRTFKNLLVTGGAGCDGNRLFRESRICKHYVTRVILAESDSDAFHERYLCALVGSFYYLEQEIHSLSLPSGCMFISALNSWKERTGSS